MLNNAFRPYDNKLFPGEDPSSDRLINQLLYRPFNYTPENIPKERYATIHISGGVNSKYELGELFGTFIKLHSLSLISRLRSHIIATCRRQ